MFYPMLPANIKAVEYKEAQCELSIWAQPGRDGEVLEAMGSDEKAITEWSDGRAVQKVCVYNSAFESFVTYATHDLLILFGGQG